MAGWRWWQFPNPRFSETGGKKFDIFLDLHSIYYLLLVDSYSTRIYCPRFSLFDETMVRWSVVQRTGSGQKKKIVLWFNGPGGAGKTAIAQSLCKLCASAYWQWLAGRFFFSRYAPTGGRSKAEFLFPILRIEHFQTTFLP